MVFTGALSGLVDLLALLMGSGPPVVRLTGRLFLHIMVRTGQRVIALRREGHENKGTTLKEEACPPSWMCSTSQRGKCTRF